MQISLHPKLGTVSLRNKSCTSDHKFDKPLSLFIQHKITSFHNGSFLEVHKYKV